MSVNNNVNSQLFEIKGEKLSELSMLVKKVGDQQKDMILDISKQLGTHNEMMEKAIDKQTRIDSKIASIEELLLKKASLGFKRKQEKIEAKKKQALLKLTTARVAGSNSAPPKTKQYSEDAEEVKELPVSSRGRAHSSGSRSRKSSRSGAGKPLQFKSFHVISD